MSSGNTAEQGDSTPAALTATPLPAAIADLQLLLDLPHDAAAAFKRAELLTGSALRRPTTRKLRQVFWDTADHRLGRAGLAIAMQTAGQKRTQLLRNIRQAPTGGRILHQQDCALSGDVLDLTRLALLPGGDPALVTRLAAEMLVPVFALELTRTIWPVDWNGTGLTVTLDIGGIESAAGRAEFCQVALTPNAGPPQGLDPAGLSADQRHRLVAREPGRQRRAGAGHDGAPGDPGDRPGRHRGGSGRDPCAGGQCRARTDPRGAGGDPPAAVGLSVFRDALPAFSRQALARDLGALASTLGHARELDVFLSETLEPLARSSGEEACLRGLRLTAAVLRQNAAETARRSVSTPDVGALSFRLAAWFDAGIWPEPAGPEAEALLDQPFIGFARTLLRKNHRKLLAAGDALRDPQPDELHTLRIQAKRLRYTAEFVRPLFSARPARRYISALKAIQDILGTVNDAAVARVLLPHMTKSDLIGGARAGGLVTGFTAAQATAARGHFAEIWKRFADTRRFWK
jgi:triphosphatase